MPGQRAIARQSLPDVIANDLRERILNGQLVEGETIRQENLATEYDVSRMPIREALKQLDAEGLVILTNNRGASVVKHSLPEIGELFDLRTLVELELFRLAIPKMTPQHFELCADLLLQMDVSYTANDVLRWGDLNRQFHASLYAAAGCTLTMDFLHRVNLQSDRYVRMHLSVLHQLENARKDHLKLLQLAEAGDVDGGCAFLRTHIQRAKTQLLDLIAAKRAADEAG